MRNVPNGLGHRADQSRRRLPTTYCRRTLRKLEKGRKVLRGGAVGISATYLPKGTGRHSHPAGLSFPPCACRRDRYERSYEPALLYRLLRKFALGLYTLFV